MTTDALARRLAAFMEEQGARSVVLSTPRRFTVGFSWENSRCEIEQARLLTLKAAWMMDTVGPKAARQAIAMIKVVAPRMACEVIDRAMQVHGAAGLSQDYFLAEAYAWARAIRLGDGPDEAHLEALAKHELAAPSH